ncbi:thioesterase family protein [Staphylococcus sp. GDY8P152P]|uniref:thioesterase family protein n=1 Tax=Staphylococcus sp. GDY8P152P TaxID=2804496 RepID=UPI00194E8D17|nr:thioesterase family protein [Staphylococcus sp. GDY8P152P]
MKNPFTVIQQVNEDMIDHNGHMHDAHYNMVFNDAINQFNYQHGLSLEEREALNYTLFTVEEHTAYFSELKKNERYHITIYLYDYNEKSVHFFSIMTNEHGSKVATNEALMLGIDRATIKTAPFPEQFAQAIINYYDNQQLIEWPKQLGHRIRISRKGV